MIRNPYKFLDYYTTDDSDVFFGREREIEEIYSRLFQSRLLILYGPSGTGKTSILRCGIAGKFPETDWLPLFIRRNDNIIGSVDTELEREARTKFKPGFTAKQKLKSLYLDYLTPIYLIFDQIEELFIFGDQKEKQAFLEFITEQIEDTDINTRIILIIREEYFADLTFFEEKLPHIFENRYRIERMSRAQIIAPITEPAKVAGINIEAGLPEKIADKLCDERGNIELTYLQVLMDRLFKKAYQRNQDHVSITGEDLDSMGKLGNLLAKFLDEQLSSMNEKDAGEDVLKTLISVDGTRKPMRYGDINKQLNQLNKAIPEETIHEIIQYFVNVRILKDKDDSGYYELRHDSLARRIYEKMSALEKDLIEVKQIIDLRFQEYKKRGKLIDAETLDYFRLYENKLFLTREIKGFLSKSKNEIIRKARKRQRIRAFITIAAFVVLLGFTFWNIREKNKAESARLKALSSASLTNSYLWRNEDPTNSLKAVIEALKYDSANKDAQRQLIDLFAKENFYREILSNNFMTSSFDLSPEEDMMIISDHSTVPKLFDLNGNLLQEFTQGHRGFVEEAFFSANGEKILTAGRDGVINIWDRQGNEIYSAKCDTVVFAACILNKNRIVTGDISGSLYVFDSTLTLLNKVETEQDSIGVIFPHRALNVFAVVANDHLITIRDENGNLLNTINSPHFSKACTFINNDLAVGYENGNVEIYDQSGKLLSKQQVHSGAIQYLKWNEKCQNLISIGATDQLIKLWDEKLNLLVVFKGHSSLVTQAKIFDNCSKILSSGLDGRILLHDIRYPANLSTNNGNSGFQFIEMLGGSDSLLLGTPKGLILIIDKQLNIIDSIKAHDEGIWAIKSTNDGEIIVSGSSDGILRIWDSSFDLVGESKKMNSIISDIEINESSNQIIACDHKGRIMTYDFRGMETGKKELQSPLYNIELINDSIVVAGGQNKNFTFINLKSQEVSNFRHGLKYVVTLQKLNNELYFGGLDHNVHVMNLQNKTVTDEFGNHNGQIHHIGLSPNKEIIATCDADSLVKIWFLPKYKNLNISVKTPGLKGRDKILDAAFSKNGDYLYTISYHGQLRRIVLNHKLIIKYLQKNKYL